MREAMAELKAFRMIMPSPNQVNPDPEFSLSKLSAKIPKNPKRHPITLRVVSRSLLKKRQAKMTTVKTLNVLIMAARATGNNDGLPGPWPR